MKVEIERADNGFIVRQSHYPTHVRSDNDGEGEIVIWEHNDRSGVGWYVRFGRMPR